MEPPTPRPTSRSSRGSRRCAAAPACTSARPTSAACTTWSTRSSTTPSTRRWPGYCDRIEITIEPDGHVDRRRQRPRHPGRQARQDRTVGARDRADRAARRRQVRRRRLQGVRRPARRRRLRRQRALRRSSRSRSRTRTASVYRQEYERGKPDGTRVDRRSARSRERHRHDDPLPARRRHLRDARLRLRDARHSASARWRT